jgi:tRNA(Ile)-lysidine synthase
VDKMKKRESKSPSLEDRLLVFIRANHLIEPGEKLVVAISGGPDSVCLLHTLYDLRSELGISLHLAHLDHGLRGAEAEADADYVSSLAAGMEILITREKRDVKGYRAQHHLSLEEAAREVRYRFLADVAGDVGTDKIALGHTRDDNVETILMHIIRGSGTRGMRGLRPVTAMKSGAAAVTIIRPLLQITREETETYCQGHGLTPCFDSSNLSLSPLRNRIRRQLLPLLRGYNAGIDDSVLRLARIAGDDIDYLDGEVKSLWHKLAQTGENTITLDKKRFQRLPAVLKRYLLRAVAEKILGNTRDIEMRHLDKIMAALEKPAGKSLDLPDGLVFSIDYDSYIISARPVPLTTSPALEEELAITVPGETVLPGWRITTAVIDRAAMAAENEYTAFFDLKKTGNRLTVRTRRAGDRFQPLGLVQSKKLNQFMIDARLPRRSRADTPLVCSPQGIIWVVGWRIDDRVKVTDTSGKVLRLSFEKLP